MSYRVNSCKEVYADDSRQREGERVRKNKR